MATVVPECPEILGEPDGLYEVIDSPVVEKQSCRTSQLILSALPTRHTKLGLVQK